jgi:hypothetical protein
LLDAHAHSTLYYTALLGADGNYILRVFILGNVYAWNKAIRRAHFFFGNSFETPHWSYLALFLRRAGLFLLVIPVIWMFLTLT